MAGRQPRRHEVVPAEPPAGGLEGAKPDHSELRVGEHNSEKRQRGADVDPVSYQFPKLAGGVQMETFIPWTLLKRGVKKQVITPIDAPEHFREARPYSPASRKANSTTLPLSQMPRCRIRRMASAMDNG